jgi:hypothetical protein
VRRYADALLSVLAGEAALRALDENARPNGGGHNVGADELYARALTFLPFFEAFAPHLTVYSSDPECRVNLGAISNKNGGDCTPLLMGIVRAAATPDPTKPPTDPTIFDDSRLYPIASVACDRASAAGFDSLGTITGLMKSPQTAVLPDDPRYKIFQSMPPITINDSELGKIAKVESPRVYRIVGTGTSGRVKKKITAIIDTRRGLDNQLTMVVARNRVRAGAPVAAAQDAHSADLAEAV